MPTPTTISRRDTLAMFFIVALTLGRAPDARAFTTVINVPPDVAPASIGSDTQLNLSDGGTIGPLFRAGIAGGGSTNVEVNISGGTVGENFAAYAGSQINIDGGIIGDGFFASTGSNIAISGGRLGIFRNVPGSTVTIYGDDLMFGGGEVYDFDDYGDTFNIANSFLRLSVTLTDGSVSIFSVRTLDAFSAFTTTVVKTPVPPAGPSVINSPIDPVPAGLRWGQTLNLGPGADLGEKFGAVRATLNVNGGTVGNGLQVEDTDVTISGGSIGAKFYAYAGSNIHMTGGVIGDQFVPLAGAIATIDGGIIGDEASAGASSQFTLNNGTIGYGFDASPGSKLTVNGGTIGDQFDAYEYSVVNINGGFIGNAADLRANATVNIRGGRFGSDLDVFAGSTVKLIGGEFLIDGQPVPGLNTPGATYTLSNLSTVSGTLQDGSVFVYSSLSQDNFDPGAVTLQVGTVPAITPVTIHAPADPIPNGVRAGETLILSAGANAGDHFSANGGTIQVDGGTLGVDVELVNTQFTMTAGSVGDTFKAYAGSVVEISGGSVGIQGRAFAGSTVTISGGNIGATFAAMTGSIVNIEGGTLGANSAAFAGSTVNISGGSLPTTFRAFANSVVNIVGDNFFVTDPASPGNLIDLTPTLTPGVPYLLTSRTGVLTGTLADGSSFNFNIKSYFQSQATLTIMLAALLEGDLDGDGFVGIGDLNLVLGNWNQTVTPGDWLLGDPTGDGFVGIEDLTYVLGNWNAGTPPGASRHSTVPEPGTLAGLGLVGGLLLKRRG